MDTDRAASRHATPRRLGGLAVVFIAIAGLATLGGCASSPSTTSSNLGEIPRSFGSSPSLSPSPDAAELSRQAEARRLAAARKARIAKAKASASRAAASRAAASRAAASRAAAASAAASSSAAAAQPPAANCTPGYDPCIPPGPDVDCAGGSGNGPRYVDGPVSVTGSDPYGLDADHDGIGCEN